ncbi:MAG: hypothetical protein A3G32_07300 [Deltaproteobacteria bacterium RIFCSPLOWO2_12_FULL_40_28]|nr:MAG: hypothetical protein A3C45_07345 [Deltaproteobacteria bacterium RIFCSPHIGHO2_02_FULL_40_28]OGQ19239.1 MAG: hypothetical protein A3E27_04470 [Deltaproteobacteria bacterium RIFCSPHIGHO2_12_FULL_40_32]OGQ40538.1 MAG: hypothetical protein A3I69_00600 [Deltaproteobacteria bacterium RIFCSPLOWO2_02_FULL_40_36]OGQ53773.1 MAG: hypothetical protein A3G32_07300 [Deltaproteobacteria bacterium RIFCSPLOWO2_12_FULL_40_28]
MSLFSKIIFIVFLVCSTLQCGGSSGSSTTTSSEPSDADLALFIKWSGAAWEAVNDFMDSDKTLSLPITCPGGGTMTESGSSIALNDCIVTSNSAVTYLGRGTYTVTESGSLVTHEWDQDLIIDDETFSTTGSISFDTLDDLIAFDFSATFSSGVYRITGVVTNNSDGTSDLTLSILHDGEVWQDGTFDNADLSALTDSEVDSACSDNDDAACSTLECSNDFQCQLFADDDPDDEFTTGNTECASGCCALVAEESDCDDTTISCTTDFQCQLFADDDTTDEFETDNVECADDGCCALIE